MFIGLDMFKDLIMFKSLIMFKVDGTLMRVCLNECIDFIYYMI